MKPTYSYMIGNALLIVIALMATLAILALTVYTSLQKTNLNNKAATDCSIYNFDNKTCISQPGCQLQQVTCSEALSAYKHCPSSDCNLQNKFSNCSDFNPPKYLEADCVSHKGCSQYSQPQWGYCTDITGKPADKRFCASQSGGDCEHYSNRCKYVAPVYKSCSGTYDTGTLECVDNGQPTSPQACVSCSMLGTPNKTECSTDGGKYIITFDPNGCSFKSVYCGNGTCHPPDTYHSGYYCL